MEDCKRAIRLYVSRRTRNIDAKYYITRDTFEQGKVCAIYVVDTWTACRYSDHIPGLDAFRQTLGSSNEIREGCFPKSSGTIEYSRNQRGIRAGEILRIWCFTWYIGTAIVWFCVLIPGEYFIRRTVGRIVTGYFVSNLPVFPWRFLDKGRHGIVR